MKILHKLALPALVLSLCLGSASADGILLTWSGVPGITEQAFNAAKQLSVEAILRKNLEVSSWPDAYLLMVGATQHKEDRTLRTGLVAQLTVGSKAELKSTSRLIIWERISSGEIQFEGKGYQVSDDLFTVAGRANWMLRNLTKKVFGYVRPNTSAEDLTKLKDKWHRWLNGETVDEYQDQYPTAEKGLSEIRSLEGLEALIVSLRPTSEKDRLTKDCLNRLYHIDKLPDDVSAPGALCSPDAYTPRYLAVITGINDKHDYGWWTDWWQKNRNQLSWNREKGSFEIKR